MKSMMLILMGSTAMIAAPALAQSNQNMGRGSAQYQNQQQQGSQYSQLSASEFVSWAAMSNELEIESSQLALQRTRNQQIRQFAQQMIDDHRNAASQLREAASGMNVPTQLDQDHQDVLADLRNTRNNFDQQFINFQVEAHQDTIDVYREFQDTTSNRDLREFVQNTLPVLQDHLRMAQRLQGQIGGQAQTSQRQQRNDSQRMGSNGQQQNQRYSQQARIQNDRMNQQDMRRRSATANDRDMDDDRNADVNIDRTTDRLGARITVQQPSPRVNVEQARPRITVRQAPPRVTIEQPQPEIIVRMPPPDVNVAQAQPQVSVRQPQPRVNVLRERGEQVSVDRADRPIVNFERQGQPQVFFQQAEGQPKVRFEQMQSADLNDQNRGASNRQRTDETASLRQDQTQQDRSWIVEAQRRASDGDTMDANVATTTRRMNIGDLSDMDVYNARGQKLGEIEQVVMNPDDNRRYIVLASGGFLGLFENEVALPLERVRYENGRLIIRGLTEQDIEQMPDWENRIPNRRVLRDNDQADVVIYAG